MEAVELTNAELMQAALTGVMRRVTSIRAGHNKNKHAEKSDWQTDIDGSASELAVAKYFGCYWSASNNTFKDADLDGIQVRSTTHKNGHLIIRPNDEKNETFVLVLSDPPTYTIVGWIASDDAKQQKYWRDDANSWWVPQGELHSLTDLKVAV